jgi:hypothetical protein
VTRLTKWAVVTWLLAAPYYYYRFPIGAFNLTLFRMLLVVAAGAALSEKTLPVAGRRDTPSGGYSWRSGVACGLAFLAYTIAQVGRADEAGAASTLLVQAEGYLTVFVILTWACSIDRLITLRNAFLASTVIPVAIGYYQAIGYILTGQMFDLPLKSVFEGRLVVYDDFLFGGLILHPLGGSVFPRVAGPMVDPNFFGSFLAAAAVMCLAALLFGAGRREARRLWPTGLLLFLVPCVVATMSRSAWLGLAVGAFYVVRKARSQVGALGRLATRLTLIAVLSLIAAEALGLQPSAILQERVGTYEDGLSARRELAEGALKAFAENPLLGVGRTNLIRFNGYPTAHTFYLTRLGEDGLVGSLLVFGFIIGLWRAPERQIGHAGESQRANPEWFGAWTGVRGAVLAVLSANTLYDHLMSTEVHWFLIGLFVSVGRLTPPMCLNSGSVVNARRRMQKLPTLAAMRRLVPPRALPE